MTNTHAEESRFYLSSNDVDRLMRDHSSESRLSVMHKVAQHYRGQNFTEHELGMAEQIFRLMMKDAEVKVREQLSDELKNMPGVPRDIVMHLASDVPEVSLPVIQMSQVLSDADLVYLVQTSREVAKIQAVAKREHVSERVADAVVETNYPDVIETLVSNPNASLSSRTMEHVVQEFAREGGIMEKLAQRDALPMAIAEKLVRLSSAKVADALKERMHIDAAAMDTAREKARERATIAMLEGAASDEAIDELAGEMMSQQQLTPSLLFTALVRGQVTFFAAALGRFASIPHANAKKLVMDKSGLGYKALYDKSGLPESMYDASRVVLRHVAGLKGSKDMPGTRGYANQLAQRILADTTAQEVENLAYMLALIRQNVK